MLTFKKEKSANEIKPTIDSIADKNKNACEEESPVECTTPSDAFILDMPDTVLDYSEISYPEDDVSEEEMSPKKPKTTWEEYQRKTASIMEAEAQEALKAKEAKEAMKKALQANTLPKQEKPLAEGVYNTEEKEKVDEAVPVEEALLESSEEIELEDEDLILDEESESLVEEEEKKECASECKSEEEVQNKNEIVADACTSAETETSVVEEESSFDVVIEDSSESAEETLGETPEETPSDNELVFISLDENDSAEETLQTMQTETPQSIQTDSIASEPQPVPSDEEKQKEPKQAPEPFFSPKKEETAYISASHTINPFSSIQMPSRPVAFTNSGRPPKAIKAVHMPPVIIRDQAEIVKNPNENIVFAEPEELPIPIPSVKESSPKEMQSIQIPEPKIEKEPEAIKEIVAPLPAQTTSLFDKILTVMQTICLVPLLGLQISALQGYGMRMTHTVLNLFSADTLLPAFFAVSFVPLTFSLLLSTRALINAFLVEPTMPATPRKETIKEIKIKGFYLLDLMQISLFLPFSLGMARPFLQEFFRKPERGWALGKFTCELLYIVFILCVAHRAYETWRNTKISTKSEFSVIYTSLPRVTACISALLQIYIFRYLLQVSIDIATDYDKLQKIIAFATENILTPVQSALQ
ncbi:hypothetical protein NEAUS06_0733 [Nematocida ausubeli]|nr:hypothetical protein NEAUS06_0733 [Nematocida ausubeli]